MPKTKLKTMARVRSSRLVLRRVYRGWVTVEGNEALPKKVDERTEIIFGNTKWRDEDRRCRITVEIYGKPQNHQS
jgi:hypothetical protein